ncbi:MAG: hypothetical protein E6Q97_23925 [Desulfurellales bacterium]|nr:MAG: hypothetical protein E6Q97_23925 [Desulfurellales bacterium]
MNKPCVYPDDLIAEIKATADKDFIKVIAMVFYPGEPGGISFHSKPELTYPNLINAIGAIIETGMEPDKIDNQCQCEPCASAKKKFEFLRQCYEARDKALHQ